MPQDLVSDLSALQKEHDQRECTPSSHSQSKISFISAAGILFIAWKRKKTWQHIPSCASAMAVFSMQEAWCHQLHSLCPPWQQWLHRGAFVMDIQPPVLPGHSRTGEYCWHCLSHLKYKTGRTCQIFPKSVLQFFFFFFFVQVEHFFFQFHEDFNPPLPSPTVLLRAIVASSAKSHQENPHW